MSRKILGAAIAAILVLATRGLSAQAIYISAKVAKARAASLDREIAAMPLTWTEADAILIADIAARAKSEGSLVFMAAAIAEKAREGTASLPELLFLIAAGAYSPMDLDIARGALAIAARDAGLELAASTYLVQLLQDNYGLSIAYRMPSLEEQGIRTIEELKSRWGDVERLLADGEDAQRWINRLAAAGEYEWAIRMLDLALKRRLVSPVYAKMMRSGLEKLMAEAKARALAAEKGEERTLVYTMKSGESFNMDESFASLAVGGGRYAIAVNRGGSRYSYDSIFLIVGGEEYGPGYPTLVTDPRSSAWAASLDNVAFYSTKTLVFADSAGGIKTDILPIAQVYIPIGGYDERCAVFCEDKGGEGYLELGDGRRFVSSGAREGDGSIALERDGEDWLLKKGAETIATSSGKIDVCYGSDGYWLASFPDGDGVIAFIDSRGSETRVYGDRVERCLLDSGSNDWTAIVNWATIDKLIARDGSVIASFAHLDAPYSESRYTGPQAQLSAFSLSVEPKKEGSGGYAILDGDGTELAATAYPGSIKLMPSPDGGAWALFFLDGGYSATLLFSDGTTLDLPYKWGLDDARVAFLADGSWIAYTGTEIRFSDGSSIENVGCASWDATAAGTTLYWIELDGDDIYHCTRRL